MKKLFKYILFLSMSLHFTIANASGISMFADILNWRASEQTASSWSSDITTPQPGDVTFSPENINFDSSRGLRLGVIYEPASHFWDTTLYWTYFPTKTTSSVARGAQILVPEFFSGFLSGNFFFGGSINWQIVMNTIDLEASHQFKLTDSLKIRPAIGIKGATINQTINATWDAYIYAATEKLQNNFSGAGPSLGLTATWNIYDSFNLIGRFSTAYMWGNWKVNDTYTRPSALFGLITPTTINTTMNNAKLGTMVFDYFIGLELLHPKKSRYSFNIGYEMQSWSNQLRLPTFQQLPEHGDLTFQGATCRLQIDL